MTSECIAAFTKPDVPAGNEVVEFVNFSREENDDVAVHVRDKSSNSVSVRFKDWQWRELMADAFKFYLAKLDRPSTEKS